MLPKGPFVIYNIRETYHELGRYEFKLVLDPACFRDSHFCSVSAVDPDGKPFPMDVKHWGRKMNCSFELTESVPDGVVVANFDLRNASGSFPARLTFWVVKP